MRKFYLLLGAVCAIMSLCGCSKDDDTHITATTEEREEEESMEDSKSIRFYVDGISTYTESVDAESANAPVTRASVSEVGCTDIWVWEGTTLLKHQVSTDSDFGSPTIALSYGTHNITFIASSSKEQSWTDGVWSTTKVVGDYAKVVSMTIDGSSNSTQQVTLERRSSRMRFTTTDNVPTTVTQCHVKVHNHLSLAADLTASNGYTHEATVNIASSQGSTYSVFVNTLTASATDEEDCDVMIEFLDASNNVLYHYERTVKLQANRCTVLTGAYFSGTLNSVQVKNTWLDDYNQSL